MTTHDGFTFKKLQFRSVENVLRRLDPNLPLCKKDLKQLYPIPKGDSAYSQAKRAEYIDKNLKLAEHLYKLAIGQGDRAESAIKDLAGVMHQQGKTIEAIEFLKSHSSLFSDTVKYENLLMNLRRQIVQRGNRLNKNLKISGIPKGSDRNFVVKLFAKPERINDVEVRFEKDVVFAIVRFASHSAARKTLEGFVDFEKFRVEWFSVSGEIAGDVLSGKNECKKEKPAFSFKVFSRDMLNRSMVMPLGEQVVGKNMQFTENEEKMLIGDLLE
jgi:hypothetical protein